MFSMIKSSSLALFLGSLAFGAVPVKFTSGSPAKADEINMNFGYLDSTKAAKSSVELVNSAVVAKIDASEANAKLGAKVDSSTYNKYVRDQASKSVTDTALTRRVTAVEGTVANKIDKGTITASSIHAISDTLGVSKSSLTVKGSLIATGDVQTNSVTRIDGNGNGLFSTVQAGTTPVAFGKSAMTVQAAGENWEQGIEILPSPDGAANKNSGWGGLFLRAKAGSNAGSWAILRSPTSEFNIMLEGIGSRVPMEGTLNSDAPLSIDFYGNTYLGGSLSVRRKILASNAEITDLRVAGTLRTSPTEPWADYVFEPGYKAMALKDVATFAKANGHLPEVPSAAEVAKDGIDLARMNVILLKKIEELTLHAVAQEKRMKALSAKVEALESERK